MIFTFYSYKGGVGRSMAMASVAHLLARRGLRVLAIDFDLEAPGLERYFFDGERSKAVRAQPGLLDLIQAYRKALSDEAAFASGEFKRWRDFRLTAINVAGSLGGSVDLMTAGRREPESAKRDYALAVRSFDWQDFFYNWKGDLFFDWLRRQLRNPETGYDVVLVDSRTGVTEMGGVCAYQLADVAVLLCAPNYQNLDGTLDVVRDFRSESVRALRRGRPLEILALPARLEASHPGRAAFLALFKSELGVEGLPAALAAAGLDYEKLALPYLPQFAVAEQLVGEAAREKEPVAMVVDVFERLADALTLLAEPDTPLGRQRADALQRLTGGIAPTATELVADTTKSSAGYDAFIEFCRADFEFVQELVSVLERAGHRSFLDRERIEGGQDWPSALEQALAYSSVLLVCFGQPTVTELRARTIAQARRLQTVKIIPVLLPGADERALASFDLGIQQALDLRDWPQPGSRERLLDALAAATAGASRASAHDAVAAPERDPYPGARAFGEDDAAYFFGREREVAQLVEALRQHDIVWVNGAAQVGKTSLIQAGLLPPLRRAGADDPLHFDTIESSDLANASGAEWPERSVRGGASRLQIVDGIDSFDLDGSAAARAARFAVIERILGHAGKGCRIVLVARDSLAPAERTAVLRLMQDRGAAVIDVQPLSSDALRCAIEEPARRAAHLLEPGLAERLIESAGSARSAIAQIQLALAAIWPERKRGWLTNKNLDAAGHLGGIVTQRRRSFLAALAPVELAATRILFSRLVALSSTYAVVTSPQPWATVAGVPAIERIDAVALRDRLAGVGLIDLYNADAVDPQNDAPARELQVALTRPDVSVYLSDDGGTLDLRFLLWRDPLSSLAWRWNGSNADALLRGSALAEAQHWLADRVDQLTRKECEFINASTTAQESEVEQRRSREDRERAAREAHERERREAAETLATEQGERLKLEVQTAARLRRGRRWLVGLLVGSMLMSAFAAFQTVQEKASARLAQTEAQSARAYAQSAEVSAQRVTQALEASKEALESAVDARRAAQAALAARSELARSQAKQQLVEANDKIRMAQAGITNVQKACPVGRRLYLHIAQESDRDAARALVPLLETEGFIVPSIDVKQTPQTSDVRYFRPDEEAVALSAARVLQAAGVRKIKPKFLPGYEQSTSIRPCHYEAWIAADALAKYKR